MLAAMGMGVLDTIDPGDFPPIACTCPRCGAEVEQRFPGPCGSCADALRGSVTGEARAVDAAEYVPKMNVTPNAVALKDD